ncbi:MAG: HlyD family efflux transporter periplasmic adaptor subunit [Planctomycetes bacterium]|nr:HlyD family efflux transporter periplasmic adaptor subunit [Planctomycetota bacterium]
MQTTLLLSAFLCVTGPADITPAPRTIQQDACLVSLLDEVQISAYRPGVLTSLKLREGEEFTKGDELALMDEEEARLAEKIAMLERDLANNADNELRIEAARKSAALAHTEWEIQKNLRAKASATLLDVKRAELSAQHGDLQVEISKRDLDDAKLTSQIREQQLQLAKKQLADYRIRAPLDGVVAEVYRRAGEWVQQGTPIFRVVRMDRLKVETFVDSNEIAPHEIASGLATVTVQLQRGQDEIIPDCPVSFVSPELEANGDIRIWVEVENRRVKDRRGNEHWLLRPGMTATMSIQLDGTEP